MKIFKSFNIILVSFTILIASCCPNGSKTEEDILYTFSEEELGWIGIRDSLFFEKQKDYLIYDNVNFDTTLIYYHLSPAQRIKSTIERKSTRCETINIHDLRGYLVQDFYLENNKYSFSITIHKNINGFEFESATLTDSLGLQNSIVDFASTSQNENIMIEKEGLNYNSTTAKLLHFYFNKDGSKIKEIIIKKESGIAYIKTSNNNEYIVGLASF